MKQSINKKVAITQPYIIAGGRFEVILGFVQTLNALGYVPDIVCLDSAVSPADVEQKYGQNAKMTFRRLSPGLPWKSVPQDYQILIFNRILPRLAREYGLVIDSGNSQLYLPAADNLVSYVHFPREYRVFSEMPSIHLPHLPFARWSGRKISNRLLRAVYRRMMTKPAYKVVCNSEFTRDCFLKMYPSTEGLPEVIYPPVRTKLFSSNNVERENAVISVGRFAEDKGQLEILKLAEILPQAHFHLVGFAQKHDYVNRCQAFMEEHGLKNVDLHVNAGFSEMVSILQRGKYFLHGLIDEPFGLSAVQAIAAGCIPIVHDSGGQRETVPADFLRYQEKKEISGIIEKINSMSETNVNDLRKELQCHMQDHFSEEVFAQRSGLLVQQYLK